MLRVATRDGRLRARARWQERACYRGLRQQLPEPGGSSGIIFMNEFLTDGADGAFTVVQVNDGGYYDPRNPSIEQNLDIQYATAMVYSTLNIYDGLGVAPEDGYVGKLR